ncbi:MAG: hypothetical protein L0177_05200, partial [Chloroflexi bacterium]|nr:hypothetical protein [Chloroflexota bacterium]
VEQHMPWRERGKPRGQRDARIHFHQEGSAGLLRRLACLSPPSCELSRTRLDDAAARNDDMKGAVSRN